MGHVAFQSAVAGLSEMHALKTEEPGRLDARRKVAFPFARKLTREPSKITREDVDLLRKEFKDKEIVELVFAICRYNTMNRLADAFGVPLESENVFARPPRPKDAPAEKKAPKGKAGEKAM